MQNSDKTDTCNQYTLNIKDNFFLLREVFLS